MASTTSVKEPTYRTDDDMQIAIIGMACRVPGARDYSALWANLMAGVNSITEVPADRWDWREYYGDPKERNRGHVKWGGFIPDAARFDAAFFGISPREAVRMDPQQRFALELAWQCIEDAGYPPADLAGRDVGVFVGATTYDYKELEVQRLDEIESHTATGPYNSMIPGRVSYFFNFRGPSMMVDAACAGSLVGVHQAVRSLRAGECEAALVGGVSLLATPTMSVGLSKNMMLSPTGLCKTFDAEADGYVRAEGGAFVLLKPLARAVEDGDDVLGIIRSSAVNHGGRARSLTAPNALSQSRVIAAAMRQGDVSPSSINYIEAHGTATTLGDPIEVQGLVRAFQQVARQRGETLATGYCALGAMKANIGHLEAGSGVASLIKVMLALRHGVLPPHPLFNQLNPRISLEESPFRVVQSLQPWQPVSAPDGRPLPRRAGVSSFGYSGTNAHVIVEEWQGAERLAERGATPPRETTGIPAVLTLSAQSEASLRALAGDQARYLAAHPAHWADVCREMQVTRSQMPRRVALVARSAKAAVAVLRQVADGAAAVDGALRSPSQARNRPEVAFVFPQAPERTAWAAVGSSVRATLYEKHPAFRAALDDCDRCFGSPSGRSPSTALFTGDVAGMEQPVLFALGYALAQFWKSLGVTPAVTIAAGPVQGSGGIVAACVAGRVSLAAAAQAVLGHVPLPAENEEADRRPLLQLDDAGTLRKALDAGVRVFLELGPAGLPLAGVDPDAADPAHWLAGFSPEAPADLTVMQALAGLYSAGCDLRFRALYQGPRQRLPLPPYPFSGDNYWHAPRKSARATASTSGDTGHPLLGRRLDLAGQATAYASLVDVDADALSYLRDHRVAGQVVLPGAAYADIALAALRQAQPQGVPCVEDLVFHRALILNEPVRLQTLVHPTQMPHRMRVETWSSPDASADGWRLHATSTVSVVDPTEARRAAQEAATSPAPATSRSVDPAQVYAAAHAQGLQYGPLFQGLRAIEALDGRHVVHIQLPPALAGSAGHVCHPALLDIVFQSVLPQIPDAARRDGEMPLPLAAQRLWIDGPLPDALRVEACLVDSHVADGDFRCDYRIYAADSERLVGAVSGLVLKRTHLPGQESAAAISRNDFFFQPTWHRAPLAPDAAANEAAPMLVLSPPHAMTWARALADARPGRQTTLVEIPRDADTQRAVFSQALQAHADLGAICFLGGLHRDDGIGDLSAASAMGVLAQLQLIQCLNDSAHRDRALSIKVVTRGTQAVTDDEPVQPWGADTHGLAMVHASEQASLKLTRLDVALDRDATPDDLQLAARQILEEPAHPAGGIVALRGPHRYLRRLAPVTLPARDSAFRPRGVYLVVGGSRGIGLALAGHLAKHFQARLVLVGRSPLDVSGRRALDEMTALGGEALYCQADVADAEAMRGVVAQARARFGPVQGAIHSALVLRDQSLAQMSVDGFLAAHDPKVRGAVALWEAVREEPLGLLMFFSSGVSFYPNRGQANYTAGCHFMDAYAQHLRQRHGAPVKIVNWGRWGDIGAVATAEHVRRLSAQGIHAISTEEGLRAIEVLSSAPATQIVAMKADDDVLRRMGADLGTGLRWLPGAAQPEDAAATVASRPVPPQALLSSRTDFNRFAAELFRRVVDDLLEGASAAGLRAADLPSRMGVVATHAALCRAGVAMLCEEKLWRVDDAGVIAVAAATGPAAWATLEDTKNTLAGACPWLRDEAELLWVSARHMARILRGAVAATEVLFPASSLHLVEPVYADGVVMRHAHECVADAVMQAIGARPGPARILEIGAGTGGTSRAVVERLLRHPPAEGVEYVYTDISPAFFPHARQRFGDAGFLRFSVLDVEKPPVEQGYEEGRFDVVFAANVLHATRDLSRTLQHAKSLLRPGGTLVLQELAQTQHYLTLSFGLLEGWWLTEDTHKRLPHSPLLTPSMWAQVLREEGFGAVVECTGAPALGPAYLAVLAAQSNGCVRLPREEAVMPSPPAASVATSTAPSTTASPPPAAPRRSAAEVAALAQAASWDELPACLLAHLRGELEQVLELREGQLASTNRPLPQMQLGELGVDSLTAMDLRDRFRKQLGAELSVEKLLGEATVQSVVDVLREQLMQRPERETFTL